MIRKFVASILIFIAFTSSAFAETNPYATEVNGTSQYWSIAHLSQTGLALTGDFTIHCFIVMDALNISDGRNGLVSKGSRGATATFRYDFSVDDSNMILAVSDGISLPSLTKGWTSTKDVVTGVGVQYVVSTGVATFYQNGSSLGTTGGGVTSLNNVETTQFQLGATNNSGAQAWHDGYMDDCQVYNNATVSVADLYNNPCAVSDSASGLQGRWRFDNNGDDSTSNNNDLTNNNSATFVGGLYTCPVASAPTSIIGLVWSYLIF